VRWATYERVCQLSRRGRLFPGRQDGHYWQNPGEAFAESYASLNRPGEGAGWEYTPLLEPSAPALAKIHADVSRPWTGPVEASWGGTVTAPPVESVATVAGVRSGAVGIGAGRAVGDPPWIATHLVRTPLDGSVTVSLRALEGANLSMSLRDLEHGRILTRVATGPDHSAHLDYSNCGHAALRLEVRATSGPASFLTTIARP